MSEDKIKRLKCSYKDCGYEWDSKTEMYFVTCPKCLRKVRTGKKTSDQGVDMVEDKTDMVEDKTKEIETDNKEFKHETETRTEFD